MLRCFQYNSTNIWTMYIRGIPRKASTITAMFDAVHVDACFARSSTFVDSEWRYGAQRRSAQPSPSDHDTPFEARRRPMLVDEQASVFCVSQKFVPRRRCDAADKFLWMLHSRYHGARSHQKRPPPPAIEGNITDIFVSKS
jgi:hypothetical protein